DTGVESFSTRIVPAQSGAHGSRLTRKSRFAQVARIHAEMWVAIEPTHLHQVDGENAEVHPWQGVREDCHASRHGRSTRLFIGCKYCLWDNLRSRTEEVSRYGYFRTRFRC